MANFGDMCEKEMTALQVEHGHRNHGETMNITYLLYAVLDVFKKAIVL